MHSNFKIFILYLFLIFHFSPISALENSVFWKLTSPNGFETYLYGTIHTDDNRVSDINKRVIDALKSSQFFLMETMEISNPNLLLMKNIQYPLYFDDQDLDKIKLLADFHTMSFERVMKMKPWLLAVIFDSPRPITPFNLDNLLKTKARDLGLVIKGLETSEEHFQVLDNFSISEQIAFLKKVLSKSFEQKEKDYEQLMAAYLSQDLNKIINVNEDITSQLLSKSMWIKVKKEILINRNKIFFNRAHKLAKNNRLFIAVGASHLAGNNGLLKQFELEGYKLNALRIE
ncbi:MAG: TraB/GumN family protein [Methylophilaceae bacterium]|nr:TraB/GumN family protein [Methylophilaceae bacterium]